MDNQIIITGVKKAKKIKKIKMEKKRNIVP